MADFHNRRVFLRNTVAMGCLACIDPISGKIEQLLSKENKTYKRADFAPMRETGYGIGVHWTSRSLQRDGSSIPHEKAIEQFDVQSFADQVVETGAGHVLFTVNHIEPMLCCPNPVVETLVPNHTHERDLPMELSDKLGKHGIKLSLYLNHNLAAWPKERAESDWCQAIGCHDPDPTDMFKKLGEIMAWMGEHYKDKVIAWWIDGGYTLHYHGRGRTGGIFDTVRDMKNVETTTPWSDLNAAAKSGYPGRLVTFNNGVRTKINLTEYQDYYAGEIGGLDFRPPSPMAPGGLPWYSFTTWHQDERRKRGGWWVLDKSNYGREWPSPDPNAVVDNIRGYHKVGGVPCFNLFIYQDGTLYEHDYEAMKKVRSILRS